MADWYYFNFGERKPFDFSFNKENKLTVSVPYSENIVPKGSLLLAQLVNEDDSGKLKTPRVKGPSKKIDYDNKTVYHDNTRNYFLSKIYGYCGIIRNRLMIIPPVILSKAKSEAYLYFDPAKTKTLPTIDDINNIIEHQKFFASLDKATLESNLNKAITNGKKTFIIAKGRAMVEAYDEYVISNISLDKSVGKINEAGGIDYKDRDSVKEVFEFDNIGKYEPASQGKEGFDVFGRIVPIQKVIKGPSLGSNLIIDSENRSLVQSGTNGYVALQNNELNVIENLLIDGNVDYESGNIEFSGSVEIKGKITSGFSVTTFGNLTVHGVVEGANLFSSGDMDLKGGLISKEEYRVECRGNMQTRYIQNAKVKVKGDVHVEDFIYHSTVTSNGGVEVSGKSGLIVGGTTTAKKKIECQQAGNKSEIPTKLIVGVDQELDEKINKKISDLSILNQRKTYIEEQLKKIVSPMFFRDPEGYVAKLEEKQKIVVVKLYEQLSKLTKWITNSEEEVDELKKFGPKFEFDPEIKIFIKKFPGVQRVVYNKGEKTIIN